MTGRLLLDANPGGTAVSMRLVCSFLEEGPECVGSWRCKGPKDERLPICQLGKGRTIFDVRESAGDDQLSHAARGNIAFPDGARCTFDGTVPFMFGLQVAAVSGRYECLDAAGTTVGQGLFGFRARSIGQPYFRLD